MADDFSCNECNIVMEVIFDHASGDVVCSECGLVLECRYIDETSEWRTFADDFNDDSDPNRVGGPNNPLLMDTPLTTSIAPAKRSGRNRGDGYGNNGNDNVLSRGTVLIDRQSNMLNSAFLTIDSMAERLSLVSTVKNRAKEIYKELFDSNNYRALRGRNADAMLAGCLFVSCQEENLPRSLKEVCSVVSSGTSKKEIGKAKAFIMQHLKKDNEDATVDSNNNKKVATATDFVTRFCYNLGTMDYRAVKAAFKAVQTSEKAIDVRRSPLSLAAAVIFVVCQLALIEDNRRPALRDVAVATGVAEGTIKNVYKDLRPHLPKIIPRWFASEDDLSNLCSV